jgi:hypothetical protein
MLLSRLKDICLSQQNITRIFDLKGSSRTRYVETNEESSESFDSVCIHHILLCKPQLMSFVAFLFLVTIAKAPSIS